MILASPLISSKSVSLERASILTGYGASIHHFIKLPKNTRLRCFITGGDQRPLNRVQAQGGLHKIFPPGGANAERELAGLAGFPRLPVLGWGAEGGSNPKRGLP